MEDRTVRRGGAGQAADDREVPARWARRRAAAAAGRGVRPRHRRRLPGAATGCAEVLVATDDAAFATRFAALGCATIPDGDTTDLNSALRQAAAEAHRRWPDLLPVALCADLPALRPPTSTQALGQRDRPGAGVRRGRRRHRHHALPAAYDAFDPHFGVDSRRRTWPPGAVEIAGRAGHAAPRRRRPRRPARRDRRSGVGAETAPARRQPAVTADPGHDDGPPSRRRTARGQDRVD